MKFPLIAVLLVLVGWPAYGAEPEIDSDCPSLEVRILSVAVREGEMVKANGDRSTAQVGFIKLEIQNNRQSNLVGIVYAFDKKKLFKEWPDRGTTTGQASPMLNVPPGKSHRETLSPEETTEEITIAGACWRDDYCEGDTFKGSDGSEVKFSEQVKAFNAGSHESAKKLLFILSDDKASDAQVEAQIKKLKPKAPEGFSENGKSDFLSGFSNQRDNAATTIDEHKAQHRSWREDIKRYQMEALQ